MPRKKAIFIAATGQNVGKTTTCLGLLSGLKKRISKLGFIKPVGQRHLLVENDLAVDKDVVLFKDYFKLEHPYPDMSPVILPRGATKQYLDQDDADQNQEKLNQKIIESFQSIHDSSEFTLVEGTGHVGVGSIVNLSNAKVAQMLGLDIILIATGGIGSTFDELTLNKALCDQFNVKIKGVILNKVQVDKAETTTHYIQKALRRWNIPLMGSIPYEGFLLQPSFQDLFLLFNAPIISGQEHIYRHFSHTRVVATNCKYFSEDFRRHQLVITPATRVDIIEEMVRKHRDFKEKQLEGGLILTGTTPPSQEIIELIKKQDIPSIYVSQTLYDTTQKINSFVSKISAKDFSKIQKAISLVEQHLDFESLLNTL
ncbi:MAG: AAA family ATPase [Chlamydiales bacterium]|nr:AAA family ATPase [Chlamydiales bacterium]